jgi:hypothetical protein
MTKQERAKQKRDRKAKAKQPSNYAVRNATPEAETERSRKYR